MKITHQQATALFVAAFFDELSRFGVRDVVVSPGSRSTALAMAAYELSCRRPGDMRVTVDIDERGAAFLALGMAKASGRPAALVCTSGTALANYYPAVVEAETSRVPLIVLSADRPPQMQDFGAPQTADQLKVFGSHVRAFRAMPLPAARDKDIAFVRQAAREAVIAALGQGAAIGNDGAPARTRTVARREDWAFGEIANFDSSLQVASRACSHLAGPVHLNFPFDAPLKPDFEGADTLVAYRGLRDCFLFGAREGFASANGGGELVVSRERPTAVEQGEQGDGCGDGCVPHEGLSACGKIVGSCELLSERDVAAIEEVLWGRTALVLAGEGCCETLAEAEEIVSWAHRRQIPLLADPLSGLRSIDDELVIDNYDNICRDPDCPTPGVIIRFGRFPVSKSATTFATGSHAFNIIVDAAQTRDFGHATDVFVATTPLGFVRSNWRGEGRKAQRAFAQKWQARNDEVRLRILAVEHEGAEERQLAEGSVDVRAEASGVRGGCPSEGAYLRALLGLIPQGSCLFSANSMSIRALDTFYLKDGKPICVMANRGQNGIDGVVSTAIGVARHFAQTTFLAGDFTLLHDLNALAQQRELLMRCGDEPVPSLVIVLLNNNGGAIFDILPQASDEPYFERLFLAPQDVDFQAAADAFGVPSARVSDLVSFREAYRGFLGVPGISLIEVQLPLRGVGERYGKYQS